MMDVTTVVMASRTTLAAVLATAAIAKGIDYRGTRTGLLTLGVPTSAASVATVALPVIELSVAAALLTSGYAKPALLGTVALMLAFVVVVGYGMSAGRVSGCRCFGAFSEDTTPLVAMFRALTLAAVAGVALWQFPRQNDRAIGEWLFSMRLSARVGLLVGVALAVTLIVRPQGWRLRSRRSSSVRSSRDDAHASGAGHSAKSLVVGPATRIAPMVGVTQAGPLMGTMAPSRHVTQGGIATVGAPTLLVFTRSEATHCRRALSTLSAWRASRLVPLALETIDVDVARGRDVARDYGVRAVPAALLLDADGTVGSRLAVGGAAIEALLRGLEHLGFATNPDALRPMERRSSPLTTVAAVAGTPRCSTCGE
jgi:hypothetical protein